MFRMLLVDRDILCRSVYFRSRSNQYFFYSIFFCSLTNIQCSFDISIYITIRGYIRIRNSDQSRQMENNIGVCCDMFTKMRITDITRYNFQIRMLNPVQPSPVIERIIIGKSPYSMPLFQ